MFKLDKSMENWKHHNFDDIFKKALHLPRSDALERVG